VTHGAQQYFEINISFSILSFLSRTSVSVKKDCKEIHVDLEGV